MSSPRSGIPGDPSGVQDGRQLCEYACEHAPISELSPSRYYKSFAGATPSTLIDSAGYEDKRKIIGQTAVPWEEAYPLDKSSTLLSKMY